VGTIYRRGNKLWAKYKGPDGAWSYTSTGLAVGQEAAARKILDLVEAQVAAGRAPEPQPPNPNWTPAPRRGLTVAEWFDTWRPRREKMRSWYHERGRFTAYILPELGSLRLEEVRTRHLTAFIRRLRETLAPRTIRTIYSAARVLFRDAVIEELIPANPCVLTQDQLGPIRDKDPEWRATAIFSRAELEQLTSDIRLPLDRRLMYGLKGLAGLRDCEARTLLWRNLDPSVEPLWRLDLIQTKGGLPRSVPVHPRLAVLLSEWKLSGWAAAFGRAPLPDDLLIPRANDWRQPRREEYSQSYFLTDLEILGFRRRRGHDLRRTMISLARADGARRDVLHAVTHGTRQGIVDVYTEWPWVTLCEAVGCMKIGLRGAQEAVRLPIAAAANDPSGVTVGVTVATKTEGFRDVAPPGRTIAYSCGMCTTSLPLAAQGEAQSRPPADLQVGPEYALPPSEGLKCNTDCHTLREGIRRALEALEGGDLPTALRVLRGLA